MAPANAPHLPGLGPAPRGPGVPVAGALPDGDLLWLPHFLSAGEADALLQACLAEIAWAQEEVRIFGRVHPMPRLTAWQGDRPYAYSGLVHPAAPWSPCVRAVQARVEAASGVRFNGVLCNRYRDGRDAMGWHADDEAVLGPAPTVASLSLGATRTFQLRHRTRKSLARVDLELTHGSLLVMRPPTQRYWQHALPRRLSVRAERVNLTFRRIVD